MSEFPYFGDESALNMRSRELLNMFIFLQFDLIRIWKEYITFLLKTKKPSLVSDSFCKIGEKQIIIS